MKKRVKLNAAGHDESQYLPETIWNEAKGIFEKFQIINPFRAAKGDIVQLTQDGGLNKALTWLPDILHHAHGENGKPLLNSDEVHVCEIIWRIVCSTRAALGISDLRNFIVGVETDILKTKECDKFIALLSGLLPYQANLCLWVVCDEYNRRNVALATKLIGNIQNSLDMAKKIIDQCNK